ncbi:hypothetical protein FACS1894204_12940 [Synergistales bacterium]|nr:hypothetical protein FACS1894204_12940 [Synergistales bacterium]
MNQRQTQEPLNQPKQRTKGCYFQMEFELFPESISAPQKE